MPKAFDDFNSWLAAGSGSDTATVCDDTATQTDGSGPSQMPDTEAPAAAGGQDSSGQAVLVDNTQGQDSDMPSQDTRSLLKEKFIRVGFQSASKDSRRWRIWDTGNNTDPDTWKLVWDEFLAPEEETGPLKIRDVTDMGEGGIAYCPFDKKGGRFRQKFVVDGEHIRMDDVP